MDPQLKSILSSLGLAAATAIAGYAATHGLIGTSDQSQLANALVTVGGAIVAAGLAWYKAHQVSQPSMIKAVNAADNGVKVVAASTPVPAETGPLK